ncbi:MAG: dockerin type I domain-containing protein [Pseudomonadota bacterium]
MPKTSDSRPRQQRRLHRSPSLNPTRAGAATVAVGALMLVATAAVAQQVENAVPCQEPAVTQLAYADHTAGCSISPGSDVDNLQFEGTVDERVRIVVHSTSSNAYDPRIELYDCGFTLHDEASCANNGCTAVIDTVLTCTGTHSILVSDLDSNEPGNYQLQLERITPFHSVTAMGYGEVVTDAVSPDTDMDRYVFNADPGTRVRLAMHSNTSNAFDPRTEIYDPAGNLLAVPLCNNNGCSYTHEFEPTMSGLHAILISDNGYNEPGGFNMAVHCIFGPCDSDGDGTPDDEPLLISYDMPSSATVSPDVDMEAFRFDVIGGTTVRLAVHSNTSNAFDPVMEIYDSAGALVTTGSCANNGCSFVVNLEPLADDTYTALVTDSGRNEPGGYSFNLQCLTGPCDSDGDTVPDPEDAEADYVFYDGTFERVVSPDTDMVPMHFHGAANTAIRVALHSTTSNAFDPALEMYAPDGALVHSQSCANNGCSFASDITLPQDGIYRLYVSDSGVNEPGGFNIHLQCLTGPCDADADGIQDGDPTIINVDVVTNDVISPGEDVDQFAFLGELGTLLRITLDSTTSNAYDPVLELVQPDGTVTVDSCSNNGCLFTFDFAPTQAGLHTLRVSDLASNEPGGYSLTVQCLTANCSAPPAPATDRDNCEWIANGPLLPDDGGNVQRDTNSDGYGNVCDADLNNDGEINFSDLGLLKEVFFSTDADADFNGDGQVSFIDLGRMKALFFRPPGPSGLQCAGNVPCP